MPSDFCFSVNMFRYHQHELKPLNWDPSIGLDGVFLSSKAIDEIDVFGNGTAIRVMYGVEQNLKDDKVYATIIFPGNKTIVKEVLSMSDGRFYCEERRKMFWNELYYNIQTNIFDNSKGSDEL